jgi:glycosyltransferase involved in cell wall biosynthesis
VSRVRVCLLADPACDEPPRGLARYTRGLGAALMASGAIDVELVTHGAVEPRDTLRAARHTSLTARREVVREHVELPRLLARDGANVLHAPANRGLPLWAPCPTVVTRHDVIEQMFPPDPRGSWRSRLRLRYADAIAMRRATVVATVSETSRADIVRRWPACAGRTLVVGEGIESRFFAGVSTLDAQRLRQRYELPRTFVLYVGGFEPRKDVTTLINAVAACQLTNVGLVLAGSMGTWREDMVRAVSTAGLTDRVRALDFVDDDDLPSLYATASCLVCPSRYEGFGLPVIEAMAAGTPAIVSSGGALPEISGGAAPVFPVGDAAALAQALERLLTEPRLKVMLIERGRRRAEEHRWERVVPRYVSLYRQLTSADILPPAVRPVLA